MIRHIVLYKFKQDTLKSEITAIFTKLAKLKDLIEGVNDFHWGAYSGSSDKNRGYNYAITVDIVDASVFIEYSPHPLHVEVRKEMAPLLEGDLLMFDFDLI